MEALDGRLSVPANVDGRGLGTALVDSLHILGKDDGLTGIRCDNLNLEGHPESTKKREHRAIRYR